VVPDDRSQITVALADHRHLVRRGSRHLIEHEPDLQVRGEVADGQGAVRIVERLAPDVLVIAQMLPGLGVPEIVRRSVHRTGTKSVVLGYETHDRDVVVALRAGAYGYVLEDGPVEHLIEAIREARSGRRFLSPPLRSRAIEYYVRHADEAFPDPYAELTERERDVLHLAAEGMNSEEIGSRLNLSPRTIEGHRSAVMHKLGFQTFADLVRWAVGHGIVSARE
jgi:DNA-binding NarL/FixJ family response regulator